MSKNQRFKKKYFVLGLVILVAVLGLNLYSSKNIKILNQFNLFSKPEFISGSDSLNNNQNQIVNKSNSNPHFNDWSDTVNEQDFKNKIKKESLRISNLTEDYEGEELRLKTIANEIKPYQLLYLQNIVLDFKLASDEKLLATELISLSPYKEALNHLNEIIKNEAPQSAPEALKLEFKAIQSQAIEGLLNLSEERTKDKALRQLTQLSNEVYDKNLNDRIQRSIWFLKGRAPNPETQDKKALTSFN